MRAALFVSGASFGPWISLNARIFIMKNKISSGDTVDLTLTAAVASGEGVLTGKLFAVAKTAGKVGDVVSFDARGVFTLPAEGAASGQAFAVGADVYWDAANKRCTVTSTSNTLIGHAVAAKSTTATEVNVRIR